MTVINDMDRFHLVRDVIERVPRLRDRAAAVKQLMVKKRIEHKEYIEKYGEDMPEIRDWIWPY
jgi:xylulose-5-phosphate/fructose-6-phosphate phosphoketolase